jgi:ribonuclease Z
MKITFLGTSAMKPTRDRATSSLLLTHNGENILLDCGEGTQRQLLKAKISPTKLTRLLISHWHGDHVLGLPGLLQTLAKSEYSKKLRIYGPKGTKQFISKLMKFFLTKQKINYEVNEISKKEKIIDEKDFFVDAEKVFHSVDCISFSFNEKPRRKINLKYTKKYGLTRDPLLGRLQEGKTITYNGKKITPKDGTILIPGKKITLISDTGYHKRLSSVAKNSDLLIIESTFLDKDKDKAKNYKHLTAKQAAIIAKDAKVKRLILTHLSERYKNKEDILKEAKKTFKNVELAKDFLEVKI